MALPDNRSTHLLDFIVDRINAGIFVINKNRDIVLWNRFMEIHSNCKSHDIVGKNLYDCFPELPKNWLERKIKNVFILKNFSFTSWEQRPYLFKFPHNRTVTGGVDYMRQDCTLLPVKDEKGNVEHICFSLFDVTDTSIYQKMLKEALAFLEEASNKDGLTDIYNRRFLDENLDKEFNRAKRYDGKLSIILLDLDYFKKINDEHGHLTGDEVLRQVAHRINTCLRNPDIVGRYGGEEFLVMLPETDIDGAFQLAERLRNNIFKDPINIDDKNIFVTISLGVSELRSDIGSYETLINEADRALYQSKAHGRNQTTIYVKP
jgi:diguanylate cyclase (GGDEF)-like protein